MKAKQQAVPNRETSDFSSHPAQPTGNANAGWIIISYLVAGMAIYGGLGWLIGHLVGAVTVATLIGLLVGLGLALVLVVFRYGRS